MSGHNKQVAVEDCSKFISLNKLDKDYHYIKLIKSLQDNWGLKYYSKYTRGFYVSFDMDYEDLVFQALKKKQATKEKQRFESKENSD